MSDFYKKIIRSRNLRLAILRFFSFIPDKWMVSLQYRLKMGRWINWKNPKSFSEKIQLYKLFYKNPLLIQCVDKYDVREYVKSLGLEHILNECYGIFEQVNEIDFDKLPQQFVMKDTLGGGGISTLICQDKERLDIEKTKKILQSWLDAPLRKDCGREWPYYSGKKHRIVVEKYLESDVTQGGLLDYKFFCFDGHTDYLWVIADRKVGEYGRIGIFDRSFNKVRYKTSEAHPLEREIAKPNNFEELVKVAEKLGEKFPQARVDLFNVKGKVYFGELTFYSGSGYMNNHPKEFDYALGEKFKVGSFIS